MKKMVKKREEEKGGERNDSRASKGCSDESLLHLDIWGGRGRRLEHVFSDAISWNQAVGSGFQHLLHCGIFG